MARTKQTAKKSKSGENLKRQRGMTVVSGKLPKGKKKIVTGKMPHTPSTGGVKKPHRYRPGTVAVREIRRYQRSTELLLKKTPFMRLLREISQNVTTLEDLRYTPDALFALQEATEVFMVRHFETTNEVAIMAKKITIQPKHTALVKKVANNFGVDYL